MICDVILRKEKDKYVASVKDWPGIMVRENSRDKAITRIKSKLLDYLTNKVEMIQIEVPLSVKAGNPWLEKFGYFKDDPTFADLEAEIESYRNEIDQKMGKLVK